MSDKNGGLETSKDLTGGVWHDESPPGFRGRPFKKGNPGGPGRPNGSLDFRTEVKRFAKANGLTESDVLDAAIKGLVRGALKGDAAASKELLNRFCGVLKGAGINVNVDARTAVVGPPLPPRRKRAVQLLEVHETIDQILAEEDEVDALLE